MSLLPSARKLAHRSMRRDVSLSPCVQRLNSLRGSSPVTWRCFASHKRMSCTSHCWCLLSRASTSRSKATKLSNVSWTTWAFRPKTSRMLETVFDGVALASEAAKTLESLALRLLESAQSIRTFPIPQRLWRTIRTWRRTIRAMTVTSCGSILSLPRQVIRRAMIQGFRVTRRRRIRTRRRLQAMRPIRRRTRRRRPRTARRRRAMFPLHRRTRRRRRAMRAIRRRTRRRRRAMRPFLRLRLRLRLATSTLRLLKASSSISNCSGFDASAQVETETLRINCQFNLISVSFCKVN